MQRAITSACNLELTYASATRSPLTLSASWMQNVRTAVLAVSACCAAWYAAQQNCSIERMTRPKHCRNDTQGTPPSETEGGIRRTEKPIVLSIKRRFQEPWFLAAFSPSRSEVFRRPTAAGGSWAGDGHFAAVGKVTRSGERNPPTGRRNPLTLPLIYIVYPTTFLPLSQRKPTSPSHKKPNRTICNFYSTRSDLHCKKLLYTRYI